MWWSKGDKNLTNKLEKDKQVVLTFPSLNISHISNYTCNAKFKSGENASITYFLGFDGKIELEISWCSGSYGFIVSTKIIMIIPVSPRIQTSPDVSENKTRNVSLSCSVSGYPLTDEIFWKFGDKKLTTTSSTLISAERSSVTSRNSTLTIFHVGDDQNGTYHCHYEYGMNGRISSSVQLKVLSKLFSNRIPVCFMYFFSIISIIIILTWVVPTL